MPGYLYNKNRFQERFIGTREGTVALKKMIQPFILRRLKKNVMMELPDKIEKKYYVEMNEEQKKVYSSYIADIKEKMNDKDINKDKITNINIVQLNNIKSEYVISAIEKTFY